jgi:programmed cell death protein 5
MDELEAIRQRRLRELQQQQASARDQDRANEAHAAAQAEEQAAAIDAFLREVLDSEALSRFTNIRLSRPDFADAVARPLVALAQAGRLPRRLTDADLRSILAQLTPKDRDINITRK